jgi:hypothetical protein
MDHKCGRALHGMQRGSRALLSSVFPLKGQAMDADVLGAHVALRNRNTPNVSFTSFFEM